MSAYPVAFSTTTSAPSASASVAFVATTVRSSTAPSGPMRSDTTSGVSFSTTCHSPPVQTARGGMAFAP